MREWIAVTIVMVVVGCSGNSVSTLGTCSPVAPCGGDVVGTWNIIGASACGSASSASCPGLIITVPSISESGTLTFNADLTYSVSLSQSIAEAITVPDSCLSSGTASVTCDQFGTILSSALSAQIPGGVATVNCVAGASCQCEASLSVQNAMAMGTYSAIGTSLTTMPDTGGVGSLQYCVSGSTLHFFIDATSLGDTGTLVESFVATKQ